MEQALKTKTIIENENCIQLFKNTTQSDKHGRLIRGLPLIFRDSEK